MTQHNTTQHNTCATPYPRNKTAATTQQRFCFSRQQQTFSNPARDTTAVRASRAPVPIPNSHNDRPERNSPVSKQLRNLASRGQTRVRGRQKISRVLLPGLAGDNASQRRRVGVRRKGGLVGRMLRGGGGRGALHLRCGVLTNAMGSRRVRAG